MSAWLAGAAAVDITPEAGIWLDGWGARKHASTAVSQRLFAKALALDDRAGGRAVVVTTDLLGFSPTMTEALVAWAASEHGISRSHLILNASHNHSGPVVEDVLPLYFALSEEHTEKVRQYTAALETMVRSAISGAIGALAPAELGRGESVAGICVNRRRYRDARPDWPQVVDQDVPVLAVRAPAAAGGEGALRAVMFGYSCHATCTDDGTIHGDYPGYAQAALEAAHPGCVALFLNGCGADANPLPRFVEGLEKTYGEVLASAVEDVLCKRILPNGDEAGGTVPVHGPLRCAYGVADVPLDAPPSRAELQAMRGDGGDDAGAKAAAAWQVSSVTQRAADHQLRILERGEPLASSVGIKCAVWTFGAGGGAADGAAAEPKPLTLVAGSGEWVADYALRLKAELGAGTTWVSSYNNELVAYVPSARVRDEGSMEGGEAMFEYRHAAPFGPHVERNIVGKVHELAEALRQVADTPRGTKRQKA